jgi:hypothetical protein
MQHRQVFLILLLAATVLLTPGCTTTIAGPEGQTTAVYRLGKLTATEPEDISTVYQATEAALAGLELSISQKLKDALAAEVIARDSQDKKVTVELLAVAKDSTKVSIKAGSFAKARRIYQKIHDGLQSK